MRNLLRSCGVIVLGAFAAALPVSRASGADILVDEDFEGDDAGDVARPSSPSVSGEVYEDSTTTGGASAVESDGTGLRYRISDTGTALVIRGIKFPFSSIATSGTVVVQADIRAEQTANGGTLCAQDPNEQVWSMHIGFGSDGNFRVHNQATNHAYQVGDTYRVTVTLAQGQGEVVVDYEVENLDDASDSFSIADKTVSGDMELGVLRFRTAAVANGAFTIDNVLVTRN